MPQADHSPFIVEAFHSSLESAVVSSFEKQHRIPLQFLFLLSIVGPHRPTPVIIRFPSWSCSSASSRLPATGPALLHCPIKGSPLTMSNCHFSDLTFYNLSGSCFFFIVFFLSQRSPLWQLSDCPARQRNQNKGRRKFTFMIIGCTAVSLEGQRWEALGSSEVFTNVKMSNCGEHKCSRITWS